MERVTDAKLREMLDVIEGHAPRPRHLPFVPAHSAIYGGVAGAVLDVPEFEVAPGLSVRQTFAHVMSPYVMAFAPPASPAQPHPGPWRPVSGGVGFDVHVEVALQEDASPAGFDRINTVWWVLSLLRLVTGFPLMLPVLSDTPFADAKLSDHEPMFWPVEMTRPRRSAGERGSITTRDLEAVRKLFAAGSELMNVETFNRAYQTLDFAPLGHSNGVALVMVWAAMETLLRPGGKHITKRLSTSVATFLEPAGGKREALQQRVASLYEHRGSTVHDSQDGSPDVLAESLVVARQAFKRCLADGAIPDCDALVAQWSAEHTNNRTR